MSAVIGLLGRMRAAIDIVYREVLKFGAVGLLAYAVDLYVFNLLRVGVWPLEEAPLGHKTLLSKVISVSVATVVAWLGNRYWTFRHRRRSTPRREFFLFALMNVGGLAISLGCLAFSHYVLDFTSALADNISGNLVGLALGTLFRFWAYRQFVFTELKQEITVGHGPEGHGADSPSLPADQSVAEVADTAPPVGPDAAESPARPIAAPVVEARAHA